MCVLIEEDDHIIGVSFIITSTKLYVPVVTLSISDSIKFLENIKQENIKEQFLGTNIDLTQPKNNNLDYLIDTKFRNICRLFVLSFKNGNNDPARYSFDKYDMLLVEIKDFNALINNKPFFGQLVKNKQEAYEKLIEMSRNDDHTTGNLLDYLYH